MGIFFKGPLKMGILTKLLTDTPPHRVGLTGHLSALRYSAEMQADPPNPNPNNPHATKQAECGAWSCFTVTSLREPERKDDSLPLPEKGDQGPACCE